MVSAAEQLASNFNLGAFAKAEELKKRLLFTLGALVIYRFGAYIPIPGIDPIAIRDLFQTQAGGVLGVFDVFAGGALGRMTIFALNIIPYISASIIMQLLAAVNPKLEALKKEGEAGRRKLNQYARYGTVVLAAFQALGIAVGLETLSASSGASAVLEPGYGFRFTTVVTLTGGTIFLMWLGEQITQRGVGNGISLIIFAGIVANLPLAIVSTLELGRTGVMSSGFILFLFAMSIAVITGIVFVERAQRRLVVQFPKRQVGNQVRQGQAIHLPFKINPAGVIPPIFASSLLLMPLTVAGFAQESGSPWLLWIANNVSHGRPLFMVLFAVLIAFFAYFYTSLVVSPKDTADNLRQQGGFIPGIRPGPQTEAYISYVLNRLLAVGSLYLVIVCLLPELLISRYAVPFYFGGTSLLIVVTVTLDTVSQIQSHLLAHQYEGLVRRARLRGARR
ncbi:MAG: preprotein translocase subunit SecY [Alphaproteobacteria bacterium]|nr:preprotein translocase subunit SecY [Alphaproteobacteria bacterium]MDA7982986.1 preprotein translocase subunit SecY [Alphaproteobacteria bacterium]MDA7983972.1 preprotein translocase subunit SecY [Alphaproteobacteria bacterium]MDA7986966.1 preprotein translocase subunit SecY [Alphaproteobacteria bacterium]MDA7999700.1 preprotein translocase subunit SecY [Alphaproteobacteria bacterium]